MRADICDPSDAAVMARFRGALASLSAERIDRHESSFGVDLHRLRIGGAILNVFVDSWSCDIEGPPEVVEAVLEAFRGNPG